MTNSILDNPLVRKYFDPDNLMFDMPWSEPMAAVISFRILRAMRDPIRKGDRCLEYFPYAPCFREIVWQNPTEFEAGWHPCFMRLPDSFQPAREKKEVEMSPMLCGCRWVKVLDCKNPAHQPAPESCCGKPECKYADHRPQPDAVEEKIKEIITCHTPCDAVEQFKEQLLSLVDIARKTPQTK